MDGYNDTTIEPAYGQRVEYITANDPRPACGNYWGRRNADGGMIVHAGLWWSTYTVAVAWKPTSKAVP